MDIEKLIERQDKLLAEATALIARRGVPASMLNRPVAAHGARMARIEQRMETLREMKAEHARQIDSEIEMLAAELLQLRERIDTDRKTFAPDIKPTADEPPKAPGAGEKRKVAKKKK